MTRRPTKTKAPGAKFPAGVRERKRADGTMRLWWEPSAEQRAKGATPVELDPLRLTWSMRRATELNKKGWTRARAPRVGRTMNELIDDFQSSLAFKLLRPRTQINLRSHGRMIADKWGTDLIVDFSKPVIRRWYETLYAARGPAAALAIIRSMGRMFTHAELRGWRPEGTNPCTKLGLVVPKGRRHTIGWAELDALMTAADTIGNHAVGHAILLSMLAGQRQTDILGARRENFHQLPAKDDGAEGGWIWNLEQSKRGQIAWAALHDELAMRLTPLLTSTAKGPLLIDARTGRPFTPDLFQKRWKAVREAAVKAGQLSLIKMQFRDLRRSFGALGRAAGVSKSDLADVLGNSAATDQFLADVYMSPQIETVTRAVRAIERPTPDERKKA